MITPGEVKHVDKAADRSHLASKSEITRFFWLHKLEIARMLLNSNFQILFLQENLFFSPASLLFCKLLIDTSCLTIVNTFDNLENI